MENKRPLILISNDDGYQSKGLSCLVEMIREFGRIIVCAPDSARSGFSCAFSATSPLRIELKSRQNNVEIWACNGTPVDCVKIALDQICKGEKPDMVIGGINHGDNASVNTHYSGTMGVVREGCMKYIPSVAFSLCDHSPDADFSKMAPFVKYITKRVLGEKLPKGICLNVNFPVTKHYKGIKACRMAKGTWGNEVVKCRHPHGYDYYWMTGEYTNDEPSAEDTDSWTISHGYVAVTPTRIDITDYQMIEHLKSWEQP
ncbi:5'/3'-nucleotidase SurE [Xylanibacter muris]|uniref:5'-nucleotidase SurE n=1 Tax=Xylanibacter muris TaxID=2736290 RepID=A0ABX2ALV8_9BACT|nr:5'/3'-nucleotidase SurE [Xylanibacter muris]NPD91577.1 5'/3'-nucleotidase SurE [Xylanibacter muris]